MPESFTLLERKNCRRFTKYVYQVNKPIDFTLIKNFQYLGEAQITEFSKYNFKSLDMFQIRNHALVCQIIGSIRGNDLIVTLRIQDDNIIHLIESKLTKWFNEPVPENS